MNIIDFIYYLMYRFRITYSFGSDEKREDIAAHAKILFSIIIYMYMLTFVSYTGIIYLLDDVKVRKIIFFSFMPVAFISPFLYFSTTKSGEIIDYYEAERSNTKNMDLIISIVFCLAPFVLFFSFFPLEKSGLPVPFIQTIFHMDYK